MALKLINYVHIELPCFQETVLGMKNKKMWIHKTQRAHDKEREMNT